MQIKFAAQGNSKDKLSYNNSVQSFFKTLCRNHCLMQPDCSPLAIAIPCELFHKISIGKPFFTGLYWHPVVIHPFKVNKCDTKMFLEISFVYLIHKLDEWGAQRLIPQIMTDVVAFKNQILQTIFHMLYIIFFSQVKQNKNQKQSYWINSPSKK